MSRILPSNGSRFKEPEERYVMYRVHLQEQDGKRRVRYINLKVAQSVHEDQGKLFILLFCAAQSEIQKHRMLNIALTTKEVFNMENPSRPRAVTFPMELMPTRILDEWDLQEIPKNTVWPTPELR